MVARLMYADVVVNCVLLVLVIIAREVENTLNGLKNTKKNWKKLKKCLTILLPRDIIDSESEGNKMEIVVIIEENHGVIGIATNYKAAKQWLIRKGWIDQYSEIYNCDTSKWESLEELYGENWKETYMNFDKEDMECMGFYLNDEELAEEVEE